MDIYLRDISKLGQKQLKNIIRYFKLINWYFLGLLVLVVALFFIFVSADFYGMSFGFRLSADFFVEFSAVAIGAFMAFYFERRKSKILYVFEIYVAWEWKREMS